MFNACDYAYICQARPVAPTYQRHRHNGGVVVEKVSSGVGRAPKKRFWAKWECPLDTYRDLKVIDTAEYRAGLIFKSAYFREVLSKQASQSRQSRVTTNIKLSRDATTLRGAYEALNPHYRSIVINICGYDQPASDVETLYDLRTGLNKLSRLCRFSADEVCCR